MKHYILCLSVLALLFITSCQKDEDPIVSGSAQEFDGAVAREWFKLECTIVKEANFAPPQASRAFGYTGIALYESLLEGLPGGRSLAGQINGLTAGMIPAANTAQYEYNWGLVANAALSQIMEKMFERKLTAAHRAQIVELENKWKAQYASGESVDVQERSIAYGNAVAMAVYEYSKTDGGHEAYMNPFQTPYTWPTNNGAWVATGPQPNPLSPKWATNRPFLTANVASCQPEPHMPYSTTSGDDFHKEAVEVYNIVKNATPEQIEITKFWADDPFNTCTPTGHTFNIMVQLLEETDGNLATSAVAFAKLGIAESDAFISCWKAKYDYFLIRPVTYIKQNIDTSFKTIIGTPSFPAYTSGHATESAAGAAIFTNMFTNGDGNYAFTDRTQIQFGFSPRSFTNFDAMALECANSRLYGGIHYNMDNLNGLKMGKEIGKNVVTQINWPAL